MDVSLPYKIIAKKTGSLPATAGAIRLSPNDNPVRINTISREIIYRPTSGPIDLRPELIEIMAGIERGADYGTVVSRENIPLQFSQPLWKAGERFVKDLQTACSYLYFLPTVTELNGCHLPGFEYSLTGLTQKDMGSIFVGFRSEYSEKVRSSIFLNCYSEQGEKMSDGSLFSIFCIILSRNKINAFMQMKGYKSANFSDNAYTYYAATYQAALFMNMVKKFVAKNPEYAKRFRTSGETVLWKQFEELAAECAKKISRAEKDIVESLEAEDLGSA